MSNKEVENTGEDQDDDDDADLFYQDERTKFSKEGMRKLFG